MAMAKKQSEYIPQKPHVKVHHTSCYTLYKLKVRIYRQHIQQSKYQMLKVEEHLRNCGNGQFKIFPFLKMRSKGTELRRAFEERFQLKFKTRLNKL